MCTASQRNAANRKKGEVKYLQKENKKQNQKKTILKKPIIPPCMYR